MKFTLLFLSATVVGCVLAAAVVSSRLSTRHATQLAERQAAWDAEKASLESELERARRSILEPAAPPVAPQIIQVTNRVSAAEILERLKSLRVSAASPDSGRLIVHQLESLIELGPAALPAIRQFLTQNQDVEYEGLNPRSFRDGKVPTEFAFPPSLRIGLLEAVKRIGGDAGVALLAEVLNSTGRGFELAYAAYALQELAPNAYRDAAVAAAQALLARPAAAANGSLLNKVERDCLFALLTFFGDATYIASAQAQVIQPSGQVDPVAVRYLQQTLREQSLPLVAQAWQDPRVAADQKEPLARVALAYVGLNPQAEQLYQTAINEPALSPDHRRNLIEDLNETGFPDPKHLTQADLPLIQKRLVLIEQLAPNPLDKVNATAFQEAYKDLVNMHNSLQPKPAPAK